MIISGEILMHSALFILSVTGFLVAGYIYRQKKKGEALICPIGFDCAGVVNSKYSNFFGIPLELFGMLYYILMSILYFLLIFLPLGLFPEWFSIFLISAPFFTFLFSLYLLFIQIFILRKGCSWCYFASLVAVLIFILSFILYI